MDFFAFAFAVLSSPYFFLACFSHAWRLRLLLSLRQSFSAAASFWPRVGGLGFAWVFWASTPLWPATAP